MEQRNKYNDCGDMMELAKEIYDIRFLQAMLPWDDNGANGGWAIMTAESVVEALGDAVITFAGDVHGSAVDCVYARYLQIGDIMVWTGELGSNPEVNGITRQPFRMCIF